MIVCERVNDTLDLVREAELTASLQWIAHLHIAGHLAAHGADRHGASLKWQPATQGC